MEDRILGIHHVTAIASDPQRNIDFYTGLMGLRLVKLTVNFDDPTAYHLYYGDEVGRPGTILTFFSWRGAPQGSLGTGQLTAAAFSIPEGAISFWADRLRGQDVHLEGPFSRFNEQVLSFSDPDGLRLELVATRNADGGSFSKDRPVPSEYALKGFRGVTISAVGAHERTSSLLIDTMGFRETNQAGNRLRYEVGNGGSAAIVDLVSEPKAQRGVVSVGTVHHIAWRTPNDDQQKVWRQRLVEVGLGVTPVIDRKYFHSIYFREPGGVLFEIATDPPGFTVDEPAAELGTRLQLPAWLEPQRREIEETLPPVHIPVVRAE
jgi:glyoxalase family protein